MLLGVINYSFHLNAALVYSVLFGWPQSDQIVSFSFYIQPISPSSYILLH